MYPVILIQFRMKCQSILLFILYKSGDPKKRAAAIVKAVTNYQDSKMLAELSEDLGEAMVGINEQEIQLLMAERGK